MDINYYSNAFIILREVLQCPFLAVYALMRLHIPAPYMIIIIRIAMGG